MLNFESLFDDLASIGLSSWPGELEDVLQEKFAKSAHGDLAAWRTVLSRLPAVERQLADLKSPAIRIPAIDGMSRTELRDALLRLSPWRKGPFDVCGVYIDAEWRSDMKWDRIKDEIASLDDRAILDVGCGNGYYALRMRGMGARLVIGVDPTLLYVMQFLAVCHFMQPEPIHVLPLRLQELPGGANAFDTVFSMGVLYHQRKPQQHLQELEAALRSGGELVLETLILPGTEAVARTPEERYARMRNVWHLPTLAMLESWLEAAGLVDMRLIDVSETGPNEQRSTDWMRFESLAEALDPGDPTRTIEGWPAPRRAALLCNKP
jgi:tRNA (mo5U34)-methyltransferase